MKTKRKHRRVQCFYYNRIMRKTYKSLDLAVSFS